LFPNYIISYRFFSLNLRLFAQSELALTYGFTFAENGLNGGVARDNIKSGERVNAVRRYAEVIRKSIRC
jgi:hypothetical protein